MTRKSGFHTGSIAALPSSRAWPPGRERLARADLTLRAQLLIVAMHVAQIPLSLDTQSPATESTRGLPETFQRLYFNLYSNSRASRAERIIEDLSLLLLAKLASELNGTLADLNKVRSGGGSANSVLIPLLKEIYPGLVDSGQRFSIGDESVRSALAALDAVNLSAAPAHVLGEAFQALMGPRLRGDKGQFFTPRSVVKSMVEVVAPNLHESVLDPACGTGGFLLEAHSYRQRDSACREGRGALIGIDKDHDLFRLSSALLQIGCGRAAQVFNHDSLSPGGWNQKAGIQQEFDVVLTNPPFGARIGIRDQEVLSSYALGHLWVEDRPKRWVETRALLGSQDPQVLFVELCVRRLKPGGRLGIVLPEGLFGNQRDSYIWEWLASQGRISGLLDCPRTTFQPGTDTKTNVLFFTKFAEDESPAGGRRQSVRIAVASHCGHDRRGRTHYSDGRPYPDDLRRLGKAFHNRKRSGGNPWHLATVEVGGYLVPRYYSKELPVARQEAELTAGATIVSIGDLVSSAVLAIRKGNEVGSDAYGTGNVPFVRTSDISNFEISSDPTKSVSEEVFAKYEPQQKLRPGDVLMVVDGRYRIGATALLTRRNARCIVQSHLRVMSILQPSQLDPYALLFALSLPSVRLRIRNLVFIQSTLGTLGKRLLELKIPILRGKGPWQQRLNRFRDLLVQRDALLAELNEIDDSAYEL